MNSRQRKLVAHWTAERILGRFGPSSDVILDGFGSGLSGPYRPNPHLMMEPVRDATAKTMNLT